MVLTQNRDGEQALADLTFGIESAPWRESAPCVQLSRRESQKNAMSKRFFSDNLDERNYAILLCSRCPVQAECLTFALSTEARVSAGTPLYGIFGGFVASKRRDALRSLTVRQLVEHLMRRSQYDTIRSRLQALLRDYDTNVLDSVLINATKQS